MSSIPDFDTEELKAIADTLQERYGETVPYERADIELRLTPDDSQVTECPAVYWEKLGCNFVLAKTADSQFFSQFFYTNKEQFGTGRQFYTDLIECLITTLQVQADHELKRNEAKNL